jgi:hypothetical protein
MQCGTLDGAAYGHGMWRSISILLEFMALVAGVWLLAVLLLRILCDHIPQWLLYAGRLMVALGLLPVGCRFAAPCADLDSWPSSCSLADVLRTRFSP